MTLKYKYFVSDFEMHADSSIEWEPGPNRTILSNMQYKFMYHNMDVWGLMKVILRFAMNNSIHSIYVAGDLNKMGYTEGNPARMHLRVLRSEDTNNVCHYWERQFLISVDSEKIEYRYGIKEKKNSMIRWERDSNRVFNFKDVKYYVDEQFDTLRDFLGVKTSTTSYTYKNSCYIRIDHTFMDDFIFSELSDNLWIGPYPKYEEIDKLKQQGCNCIINLQATIEMEGLLASPDRYEDVCN